MYKIIFTLDYEIHGNGDGSPYAMIVEPTYRLMSLLEKYNAKLTILADVAEILKFKEYFYKTGDDKFNYLDIVKQLKYALSVGHDVQLHIHSSYFGAKYENGRWLQNWETYNLAQLPYPKIFKIVKECKEWLESNLKEVKPDYQCNVFRAANWSMMPSENIVKALLDNNIKIDTSVYKYGKSSGIVNYDYTDSNDALIPWFVDSKNVCNEDKSGKLLECPIYCEARYFPSFVSFIRAFRMIRAKFHRHKITEESNLKISGADSNSNKFMKLIRILLSKHPWKLDFNQATGTQLIKAVKIIKKNYNDIPFNLPIILIGHSKSFIKYNEKTLMPFLKYIKRNNKEYSFSNFQKLKYEEYRKDYNEYEKKV